MPDRCRQGQDALSHAGQESVVAVASDLLDYVVGTTLYVDGGMTLFPGFATGG